MNKYLLFSATITTALVAGLFFCFVTAINPAFSELPDAQYIAAMQAINISIVNPLFAAAFFGPVILIPLVAWKYKSFLVWLAAAFYLIGGIGITFMVNVPLNDMLARASVLDSSVRNTFAGPWNNWHLIRTLAVIASLILLVIACLKVSDR